MVSLELPDGSQKEFSKDITPWEIAKSFGGKLSKNFVGAKFDGKLIDINTPVGQDGKFELLSFDTNEGREIYWHSSSHILAQAIKRIWPEAQIAIGPAIDTGFYYDIDLDVALGNDDIEKIEKVMKDIINEELNIVGEEVSKSEAVEIFKNNNENYKIEIINDLDPDEKVKVYRQGEFTDLCRGPHLPSTKNVRYIKITNLAGAYWRGDERNKMLQRIYGVSFPKEGLLKEHLKFLEESKKRDHRKIGKELDLFSFHQEAPGFAFWHGNGMVLYNEALDYWREVHNRDGYQELKTPIILNDTLWHKSGHWDHYKENMYFTKIDENDYAIKPMNCPGGLLVYNNSMWSYRDFPLKMAELGLVHRHEKSGVLHGLMRVRQFTQDDAHIYCTKEQMKDEIIDVIELTLEIYKTFGFENCMIELSTRPLKSIGTDEIWEFSESILAEALDQLNIGFKVNKGEGAFYGPKIDFHIKDCIGRLWQCGTIQLDFSMPERLGATYINKEGNKEAPVMIHRAILGSIERFLGILIENYAGDFPLWLAPVQVVLIPVSQNHHDYAKKINERLIANNFRVKLDVRNEKVGYKIRDNELKKIPYMLVLGDKEIESGLIPVRRRLKSDLGKIKMEDFIEKLIVERRDKK
ncbi:threonine--tRNA ligase [candidate division KSB1 bacterium]